MNLNIKLNKYRSRLNEQFLDYGYDDDDDLAPVMPAIDVAQQLTEEENRRKKMEHRSIPTPDPEQTEPLPGPSRNGNSDQDCNLRDESSSKQIASIEVHNVVSKAPPKVKRIIESKKIVNSDNVEKLNKNEKPKNHESSPIELHEEEEESLVIRNNPLNNFTSQPDDLRKQDEYEFIPNSVILDVYSNDPEVERFLKQLSKIYNETGYNEQDYKCYSCRRPIGLVFGQPRLCHFDGHHFCSECHLGEKTVIPARILCNWDFTKYPVSKRNQHYLNLISHEPMFELKKAAPLLYKMCPDLREIEELRHQAFFIRSYCTTCVHDSISFELTKLIWPKEHLFKQTDLYSLEDLIQIKSGALKQILKNVISFGRQHVLSCVLCRQKGFICELCKSSQIIYPFDTDSVHRCHKCQSIYHKACYKSKQNENGCPRCQRLTARLSDN